MFWSPPRTLQLLGEIKRFESEQLDLIGAAMAASGRYCRADMWYESYRVAYGGSGPGASTLRRW
ncbi:MAG: hypothetical protein R3C56_17050 [Pirellulaceae bacterium]